MDEPKAYRISCLRIFKPYLSTPDDLAKSRNIPLSACPRRYCWWWHGLAFDWHLSPSEGCTFLQSEKPKGWKHTDVACCRVAGSGDTDHYEPREPELRDDGFDDLRFSRPQPAV
jgi:hypothetical protein